MAKPQIVEDFAATIVETGRFKEESVTISKEDLNSALSQLAGAIMRRERSNFESYSMFYENLLRQHHQMLYQKEQVRIVTVIHRIILGVTLLLPNATVNG